MDLRDYLRAIRKRWWLVVGSVVVAVAVAVAVTLSTPPRYAASVTFFVNTRGGSEVSTALQGGQFAQQRVKSYIDVLTSNRLAQAVVTKHSLGLSADDVQKNISAQVVPDTVLVQATVTDGDRTRALRLAQLLAREFPVLVERLETPPGSRLSTVGVQIIAEPRLADAPVSPRPVRNVGLALALGLIVGAGAAALRESLDASIRHAEALGKATSAPVLSVIPHDAKAGKSPLIIEGSAQSTRAEAMRQLRTNLQFVNVDRPLKSLVVTSAVPGEGKSSTVCNLGIAFAESGKRVILVDADLRRPKLAEYLGLEGAIGLTNVLAGQADLRDALQPWGGSGMWVLPSGSVPPNPSELLASRNMADLLAALGTGFDVVIVDTPPLLPVTDAAVMATVADGCLLVCRYGKTTTNQATAASAALAAVGARLHGAVLNMAPHKGGGAYAYYSYTTTEAAAANTPAQVEPRARPVPRHPAKARPVRARPVHGQPVHRQPMQSQAMQSQAMQSQAMQSQAVPGQPIQGQPVQRQPVQGQPVQAGVTASTRVSTAAATNVPSPQHGDSGHTAVAQVRRGELEPPTTEIYVPAVYRSGEATLYGGDHQGDVRSRR